MSEKVVTYVPDNSIKHGFWSIFTGIYSEVVDNRWLTFQLFKRDFVAMYKQSFIGVLWIVIVPVINVGIFAMLNRSGIFNVGDINAPYPLYALLGMAFWQLFSSGVTTCGGSLTSAGDMIKRINCSRKSLVLSSMGRPIISFGIQFILIALLFVFYKIIPAKTILFAPFVLIPIVFLTLGMGFVIALLNAIVRDTGNFLSLAMQLMMYATPVLYSRPQIGLLSKITRYNPMYYFISAGRDLVLDGKISEMKGFIVSIILSTVVLILSIVAFHLTETRMSERV
ncbi:MAG: ABC transporter permease [Nanoarchaeota archaeon]